MGEKPSPDVTHSITCGMQMIDEVEIAGYRSIRRLRFRLRRVNVITGPNGVGKSNLYRALHLLAGAAQGGLPQALAEEGGLDNALWAGRRQKGLDLEPCLTMKLLSKEFCYELQIGKQPDWESSTTLFAGDPRVQEEYVWHGIPRRPSTTFFSRNPNGVWGIGADGEKRHFINQLDELAPVLMQLQEPHLYPELSHVAGILRRWRFYHHFDTGPASPLRQPQPGVRTLVLDHQGRTLGAALASIAGDPPPGTPDVHELVSKALGGAELNVDACLGRFYITLQMPGMKRPLTAQEFSDGSLRFLCLTAALLSPLPAPMLVLNEPETSLHPDLMEPLAELIAHASTRSQVWVITHSTALRDAVARRIRSAELKIMEMEKVDGETRIVGQGVIVGD